VSSRLLRIDTNAIDDQGGIVAVQLGLDGEYADPQPYYDSYRWKLTATPGRHELSVRYTDRAGNVHTISRAIDFQPRPEGHTLFLPLINK
jgi:hypothetical protein